MHDYETASPEPPSAPSDPGASTDPAAPRVLDAGGTGDDPAHPWRARRPVIARPEGYDHGILADGTLVPLTPEAMVERLRSGGAIPMAWSPADPYLVWPEELPFLFGEIRQRLHREALHNVYMPAGLLALLLGLVAVAELFAWRSGQALLHAVPVWPLFAGLLAAWMGVNLLQVRRSARLTPAEFRDEVEDAMHEGWIRKLPVPGTDLLRWAFVAIGLAQLAAQAMGHNPILAAGLVKPIVHDGGQPWRLLSAAVLHVGLLHFFFNFSALLWLGRQIEVHANRACQALSFVAGAVVGNLFSTWLMPNSISIGASTGLMGMFGFLAVLAWRRGSRLPHGLLRGVLLNVAFIAAVGLVANGFVDNAGHLGGLVGGLAVGFAAVPRPAPIDGVGWRPGLALNALGLAAFATILGTIAATGAYLFFAPV